MMSGAMKRRRARSAPDLAIVLVRGAAHPLCQQIYEQIRTRILGKLLEPDDAIPPSRILAEQLKISRMVVVQAYDRLLAEGYIRSVRGSGTFVSKDYDRSGMQNLGRNVLPSSCALFRVREVLATRHETPPPDGGDSIRYDFRHGVPAWDRLPLACWRRLQVHAWSNASSATLGYGPAEGAFSLRQEIARLLRHTRGIPASPDQIVITTGATQALSLLATVLLSDSDVALVEDPAHPVLRDIFRLAGATVVPVPVDDNGLCVEQIDQCLEHQPVPGPKNSPRLVYVTPSRQFPTGAAMSEERKNRLLEWAERCDAIIIEDDYDSEYRFDRQKPSALASSDARGRVVLVGSFSKVLFPALRIGYAYLPRDLLDPFLTAKWLSDRLTPSVEQEVLAEFMQRGHYATHIRRMSRLYGTKRATLVNTLRAAFGERMRVRGIDAGLHLLLEVDSTANEIDIANAAEALNVRVYPVSPYYLGPQPRRPGFLLGYGALSEKQIRAGVAALALAEQNARACPG